MIIRIIFVGLFVIITSACDLFRADKCGTFTDNRTDAGQTSSSPIAPTTIYCGEVQNITQTGDVIDKEAEDNNGNGNGGNDDVTIVVSHENEAGQTIYSIGPGRVFQRTGGSSSTVWCRVGSDCNGINRTELNVTNPPSDWISYKRAEFRRSGDIGSNVTFNVDGQVVNHTF